jgi:hypothetical protein
MSSSQSEIYDEQNFQNLAVERTKERARVGVGTRIEFSAWVRRCARGFQRGGDLVVEAANETVWAYR